MKNKILILIFNLFVAGIGAQQDILKSQTGKGIAPLKVVSDQSSVVSNTYAVVVGISDYQDKDIPDLRFADKDAEAFAGFLRSEAGGALDKDHIKVLLNQEATMAQFANALDWLWENVKEGDQAIIYFSGHGDVEKKSLTQPGFLLCWDAPARVYMAGGAFALPMLQEVISTLSIQNKAKVIVITDACRSGKLAGSSVGGAQATASNLSKQFANEIKILSCQPNEYSIEGEQWGGGRGAFSYNLVNALYGLADINKDLSITLQEIGRYLEDHVTTEVAPVSQLPMVLGNRNEKIASVNPDILTAMQSGKSNQMAMLSAIDNKGIEDDVLGGLDTSTRELYQLFKKNLKEKVFFPSNDGDPAIACADIYYRQLMAMPKMDRLKLTLTRNYAAALQDDAQQAINIWLKADVQQLECIGKTLRLNPIPNQLERAAELLGKEHYMYRALQARRLLFEGILLRRSQNPDEVYGRECMSLFRQSLELEPQSPLPWHRMSEIYITNLRMPDSALICARKAGELSPKWVLPLVDLGYKLIQQRNFDFAKKILNEAELIDPEHPFISSLWANWFKEQPGQTNQEKALTLFEKYQEGYGPMYPCWHNDFGLLLSNLGRYAESESEFKKAIALDSTNNVLWGNLGYLYQKTNRYIEAEVVLKKAILLDSSDVYYLNSLGLLYANSNRYAEGEQFIRKAIALDSTYVTAWNNLAYVQFKTQNYSEAEPVLKKAIALDSSYAVAWISLGYLYLQTHRYADAEKFLKKAIALDFSIANPHRHLGLVYFKTNRPEEAKQSFLQAITLNPNYVSAMLGMAYLLSLEGKTNEAIGYVEQAIGKGATLEQLEKDEDLAPLRATSEWNSLMKKHFPNKIKE